MQLRIIKFIKLIDKLKGVCGKGCRQERTNITSVLFENKLLIMSTYILTAVVLYIINVVLQCHKVNAGMV